MPSSSRPSRTCAREAAAGHGTRQQLRPGEAGNLASFKTRRGKVGGYRDYFTEAQQKVIDGMVDGTLAPLFGYAGSPATGALEKRSA